MIYVDNFRCNFRNGRYSHLAAIPHNKEELIAFAISIGLKPEWYQDNHRLPHFDVSENKRLLAIKKGAVEVSPFKLTEINLAYLASTAC